MLNRYIGQKTLLSTEKGERIQLTATTAREITYSADISDNTVETGYTISDSVINKPIAVNITQIVSTANENSNVFSYWQSIYNRLIDSRVLITVQTPDYIYKNMILTNFTVKRDAKHLKTEFTLSFRQVLIVSTAIVNLPSNYEYLKNIVEEGNGTKDANTSTGQLTATEEQRNEVIKESSQNKTRAEQEQLNVNKSFLASIPSILDEVGKIFI